MAGIPNGSKVAGLNPLVDLHFGTVNELISRIFEEGDLNDARIRVDAIQRAEILKCYDMVHAGQTSGGSTMDHGVRPSSVDQ